MKQLRISPNLTLPIEVGTQTSAILGIRGSGKTHTAKVIAEELLEHGQQIVVIDPLDAWWGLKSSADGKAAGYPVVVLGGQHGDLPVKATDGQTVADFIVENPVPCVLSLRHLSKADQRRFVTDFCERVYFRKGEPGRQQPLPIFIDEASSFVPQRVTGDVARMVGAIEDFVRRGRQSGLGVFLIDQRAASVNKDVLTQIEMLVCHRTTSPQDRAALGKWIEAHDTEGNAETFMESLASLGKGDAWVWSPSWLGVFERTHMRLLRTFDSSATPKAGAKQIAPAKLADVNLDALREQLSATVEEARANDPRELKKEIGELKKQLAARDRQLVERQTAAVQAQPIEISVLKQADVKRLETTLTRAESWLDKLGGLSDDIRAATKTVSDALGRITQASPGQVLKAAAVATPPPRAAAAPAARAARPPVGDGDVKISKTRQRILDSIAFFESIGNPEPTLIQLGAVALLDPTGGHFSNTVGPLSTSGLVIRGDGKIKLTDAGRALANLPENLATLADYHEMLRKRVRQMKSSNGKTIEILNYMINLRGSGTTSEEIGRVLSIDHTGGHFSNSIGPLGTLGLIQRRQGNVRPTEILFPPGLP